MHSIVFVLPLTLFTTTIKCLDNGLALTPPMGWMSWERYRCITDCQRFPYECISEWLFRNVTDLMVARGYLEVGYEYVIIDDCWLAPTRDKAGDLQPDPERFPSGMKALSDYIHSKGLKFGIYENYGTHTCTGYPGSLGHLERDAKKFAEWGADYVKMDGCFTATSLLNRGYTEFGEYLNQTGRPMVYSCSWPFYQIIEGMTPNYSAISQRCNLWRFYIDIDDSWNSLSKIINHISTTQDIIENAGPGHWNDPDMLLIGNFGLSYDQSKVQMALWAIMAAPLLMSTDLKAVRPDYRAILQNKQIIAVNQDIIGIQGRLILKKDKIQVWARPIMPMHRVYYSYAVAFVSTREEGNPHSISVSIKTMGLFNPSGYNMTNLYNHNAPSVIVLPGSTITVRINPSGVVFLLFKVVPEDENY